MASQYGVNYGNVIRTKMAREKMDAAQEERQMARQRNALLRTARGQAATGQPGGMANLATLAPEEAALMQKMAATANEQQRERITRMNEKGARMALVIRNSKNPAQTYAKVRESLPDPVKQQMPENYSPDFVDMMIARAAEIDKLMENPDVATMGSEDVMFRGGQEVGRAPSNALLRAQTKGGAGGGMKASQENAIYRQAVELMGGIFDEQGNIQALDPTVRPRVQAIARAASQMMINGQTSSIPDAVAMAAQQFGQNIPAPQNAMNQQPVPQPQVPTGQNQFTQSDPAQPVTPEDYQSLPSGAVYIDPGDGQLYRKP